MRLFQPNIPHSQVAEIDQLQTTIYYFPTFTSYKIGPY